MKIWTCKIGEVDESRLPAGADGPMRDAVEEMYKTLTSKEPVFTFSGWGGRLTKGERSVVEGKEVHSADASDICEEIIFERERQDQKWGGADHDDQHSIFDFVRFIKNYAGWAEQMADSGSLRKSRRRLVQVAALAVACIEAIDRAEERARKAMAYHDR